MFKVEELRGGYGKLQVVEDVSLTVRPGEIVSLVGPNGSGKSTTLKLIAGVLTPTGGAVSVDDRSVRGLPAHRIAQTGLGLVPEGRWLFPEMTVRENLLMGGFRIRGRGDRETRLEAVVDLFPAISKLQGRKAGLLSGGEQQMVAIARSLMSSPQFLMLDEPGLGLAPKIVGEVYAEVQRLVELGIGVLLVEQNVELALRFSEHVYVLRRGRTVANGSPDEFRQNDVIQSEYFSKPSATSATSAASESTEQDSPLNGREKARLAEVIFEKW